MKTADFAHFITLGTVVDFVRTRLPAKFLKKIALKVPNFEFWRVRASAPPQSAVRAGHEIRRSSAGRCDIW